MLEKVLGSDISKRQQKIIYQICRMTFGCHVLVAAFRPSDFRWCGIRMTVIKDELESLATLKIICLDSDLGLIQINPRIEEWGCTPNGNCSETDRTDFRKEVLSKQLKSVSVLRIISTKRLDEITIDSALKETLKKLNTGRITKSEIQRTADASGAHKASVRTLANKMRI